MKLTDSVRSIKGVGDTRRVLLEQVGITTLSNLLSYLPYTYEDSTNILNIQNLLLKVSNTPAWELNTLKVAVSVILEKSMTIRTRRGLFLVTATFTDSSSEKKIKAIWFNQAYIQNELKQGSSYVLFGKLKKEGSSIAFSSPKLELIVLGQPLKKLGGILPIYRRIKSITSTYFHKYIEEIVKDVEVEEFLPTHMLRKSELPELKMALTFVHAPQDLEAINNGYRRLSIQELLELRQDYEEKFRKELEDAEGSVYAMQLAKYFQEWIPKLPFTLTEGQNKIVQRIVENIQEKQYLDALLYGDVGSGKTIIALLFALGFAKLGFSSILIAPTTILASQHLKTATKLLQILAISEDISITAVLAGKRKLEGKSGTVYIGTQAILHKEKLLADPLVKFVCIDEQHRFGVEQRTLLKNDTRHLLTLSATPIPRTLALSFLGFSESYVLEEKPIGRKEVISRLVPQDKEQITYEWILSHLIKGEQVFIVFPRIESEEESEKQSLIAMAAALKEQYFSNIPSALLFGSMKDEEKNSIMADFSDGKIRLLFSTSVIEVGVDVANATIIAIHGAELFGLAQLHQMRGRVGRSSQQGYCLLFSSIESQEASERLKYFSENFEGLKVSEYDLKNRGTGTLLGKQQSGLSELKMAQVTDLAMVKEAMDIYQNLVKEKILIKRYFRVESTHAE